MWKDLATISLDQAKPRIGLAKPRVDLAKPRVGLANARVSLAKARVWEQCFLDKGCCLAFLLPPQHPSGCGLVGKQKITRVLKGEMLFYKI